MYFAGREIKMWLVHLGSSLFVRIQDETFFFQFSGVRFIECDARDSSKQNIGQLNGYNGQIGYLLFDHYFLHDTQYVSLSTAVCERIGSESGESVPPLNAVKRNPTQ
ncbi:hypothetical protein Btru_007043 [Bulinus truncatus]|nr:hypothetical protein Btru_007043 [Bulinus truncatus]